MKILFSGHWRDGTGYGRAAADYVLALDAAGADVVARPIKLNDRREAPTPRLAELEAKPAAGCDVVVQHTLPHLWDYSGRFRKNVGLFAWETSNFRNSCWPDRADQMDEVWAISRRQAAACRESGVKKPVRVVPHACDLARFQRSHPRLPEVPPGTFTFYTVGEFVRRKNLAALVKAFHLEFAPSEPVQLVVKTDRPGLSPGECEREVRKFCADVRAGLRLQRGGHREEVVITRRMTDEEILRLHASCDCFVQPSFGESWGIPAFDAMAMGRTPIVTGWGGYVDYLSDGEGWLVGHRLEPVFSSDSPFSDLYTGEELWASADVCHLRHCMREAYGDGGKRERKAAAGIRRAYDFSYEAVGAQMMELLAA